MQIPSHQRIVVNQVGGAEELHLSSESRPSVEADQVGVQIELAGVNFLDIYQRRGDYQNPVPFTPGYEGVGIVQDIGNNVHDLQPGDRVAWVDVFGSYTDYLVADKSKLILVPDDAPAGRCLLFQPITAQYLLTEYAPVREGRSVLIHAAAGGVGQIAVQWAKRLGARVIGTVSNAEKEQIVHHLGADFVVNSLKDNVADAVLEYTQGVGVDLVLDSSGGTSVKESIRTVARFGTVICFGATGGEPEAIPPFLLIQKSARLAGGHFVHFVKEKTDFEQRANAVFDGFKAGWLKDQTLTVLPLASASKAHQRLESRASIGKIALRP